MGFFASGSGKSAGKDATPSLELIHRLECKVCPLNKIDSNDNPHMKPTGASDPLIYILGEAPGKDEDYEGKQFVGESGQLLRARLPKELRPFIRWNNVVRTRPPKNRTPEPEEMNACMPYLNEQLSLVEPQVIVALGKTAVQGLFGTAAMGVARLARRWRKRKAVA